MMRIPRLEDVEIQIKQIKKNVVTALFSDDLLLDRLALKGGSALDLVYQIDHRRSVDVDLSMTGRLWDQPEELLERVSPRLEEIFLEDGFRVFDLKCIQRPPEITPDMEDIWGGYRIEFKIINRDKFTKYRDRTDKLRREAEIVGENQRRTFSIDISANEYCQGKEQTEMDGLIIAVYTPAMIVFEKIRAICQQMEEYEKEVTNPSRSPRARDFVDIFVLTEKFTINFKDPQNHDTLKAIFAAKRVPLTFIGKIAQHREFHRPDFDSVRNTIQPGFDLKSYDFYVDYVIEKSRLLQPLWEEQTPM